MVGRTVDEENHGFRLRCILGSCNIGSQFSNHFDLAQRVSFINVWSDVVTTDLSKRYGEGYTATDEALRFLTRGKI